MTSPAQGVVDRIGLPSRRAVECAFERFAGMKPCRQTSKNLLNILIPFLEDEEDTWLNSGMMCVALERSGKPPRDPDFKWYAQTRGGVWNTISYKQEPWAETHTLREVLQIIEDWHEHNTTSLGAK